MKNSHSRSNTFQKHIYESYTIVIYSSVMHHIHYPPIAPIGEINTTTTSLEETPVPSELLP